MLGCIATSEAAHATSEASIAATKTTPAAAAAEPYRSSCRLHTLAAKLERALPNWEAATLVLRVHALLAPLRTASTENSAISDAKAAEWRCGARAWPKLSAWLLGWCAGKFFWGPRLFLTRSAHDA